jgi:uncharacterized membrane protein (DUF485 family)
VLLPTSLIYFSRFLLKFPNKISIFAIIFAIVSSFEDEWLGTVIGVAGVTFTVSVIDSCSCSCSFP